MPSDCWLRGSWLGWLAGKVVCLDGVRSDGSDGSQKESSGDRIT